MRARQWASCPVCSIIVHLANGPKGDELEAAKAPSIPGYRLTSVTSLSDAEVIYLAESSALGRPVTLKVFPVGRKDEEPHPESPTPVAEALTELSHGNVVRTFDKGEYHGVSYLVTEVAKGETLRAKVDREGPLETAEAVRLSKQLCSALEYAHEKGVVHGHVTPDGVIIDSAGTLKLTDFGRAGLRAGAPAEGSRVEAYLAPEVRTQAGNIDLRADVFSIGAVAYEMLTGSSPEARGRDASEAAKGLKPLVNEVLLKSMDADPASRYASAPELARELARATRSKLPRGHGSLGRLIAATVLGVALLVGAVVLLVQRRPPPEAPQAPDETARALAALQDAEAYAKRESADHAGQVKRYEAIVTEYRETAAEIAADAEARIEGIQKRVFTLLEAEASASADVRERIVAVQSVGAAHEGVPGVGGKAATLAEGIASEELRRIQARDSTDANGRWIVFRELLALASDAKQTVAGEQADALVQQMLEDYPALAQARRLTTADRVDERVRAARTLAEVGPAAGAAMPALMSVFEEEKEPWLLAEIAKVFGSIGPEARDAAPLLAKALRRDDPTLGAAVIDALGEIGESAIPILRESLREESVPTRRGAVEALAKIGPPATESLARALRDADHSVRALAAEKLVHLDPEGIEALGQALEDASAAVRILAVRTLAQPGRNTSKLAPAIAKRLDDGEGSVQKEAAIALGKIKAEPAVIVPPLIRALSKKDESVSVTAREALLTVGPPAVPILAKSLKDSARPAQTRMCAVLGQLGPDAREAVTPLIELLRLRDDTLHAAVADALTRIDGPAVPELTKLLGHADSSLRKRSAKVLGKFGPAAKDAVPALIEMLRHEDASVRSASIQALGKIGAGAAPRLLDELRKRPDHDPLIAATAATGKPAVTGLVKLLRGNDLSLRMTAMEALGRMGPPAREAIGPLIVVFSDPNYRAGVKAAESVARIGPAAVGDLARVLDDKNLVMRKLAAIALGHMGPPAKAALPRLKQAAQADPAPTVRRAAQAAVGKIEGRE